MKIININFNKPKKVYLSHIHQEMMVAEAIHEELIYSGYRAVATPHHKSAQKIARISSKIIENVDAVVVLVSPSAMRSQQIWADIAHARFHNVPVIPMVVHHFEEAIPLHHHINAVGDLERGFERLQVALKNKNRYKNNELDYAPVKHLLRKTLVAAAIFVLSLLAGIFH